MPVYMLPGELECQMASQEIDYPVVMPEPKQIQVFIKQPLVSERPVTSTMIICGDCAGDDPLPRKTFMTESGCCDNCGGQAFVLASILLQHWRKSA